MPFVYRHLPEAFDFDQMSDEEIQFRIDYRERFMDRVRGNVALVNAIADRGKDTRAIKMAAFLELFHPDMDTSKRDSIIRGLRGQG